VLVAVAPIHLQDQLLANVARKIEIDIRHRLQVLVEKPPKEKSVLDWIDMRAAMVADDWLEFFLY